MNRTGTVLLEFDPDLNKLRKDKKLWDGLSAVVQIGDTLWVANDEALSLERLSRQHGTNGGEIRYADRRVFSFHAHPCVFAMILDIVWIHLTPPAE